MKIKYGSTPSGNTHWQTYGDKAIKVEVDTSSAGFEKTPVYVISLGGDSGNWKTTGGNCVYFASNTGFWVYVKYADSSPLSPAYANENKWHINWIGCEN